MSYANDRAFPDHEEEAKRLINELTSPTSRLSTESKGTETDSVTENDRIRDKKKRSVTEDDGTRAIDDVLMTGLDRTGLGLDSVKESDDGKKRKSWVDLIENGGEIPSSSETIPWRAFKKAVRGWYEQSLNYNAENHTRARNKTRYNIAKDKLQDAGYVVKENEFTGSVSIRKQSVFYDESGSEIFTNKIPTGSSTDFTMNE